MILTVTKYHENLLRDSPLSLLFIVKFSSSLETNMVLKIPNETFLRNTRYVERGKLESGTRWGTGRYVGVVVVVEGEGRWRK